MKRGLVIGKFMPVHTGHLALIDFAASQCDELIVSMSYTSSDPIPYDLRFAWLKQLLDQAPHIKVFLVQDEFDDESLAWPERTKHWAVFLEKTYPKVDVLISSEEYGPFLASHLKATHISFDPLRKQVPVSATQIRHHPFHYWENIPVPVRPYFVKKICLYGPESTGKSVMAKWLADSYQTEWVPEVAREFVTSNEFSVEDIIKIGYAHAARIEEKTKSANKILFCDTDAITTQIYSRHYLGVIPHELIELEKRITYDYYFLFDIDVPWVADDMRDLGDRRKEMFNIFKKELDDRKITYELVSGKWKERQDQITSFMNMIIHS